MCKLELKNVEFYRSDSRGHGVDLSDISLHINNGEIVTLLGKSGTGKSTIANIMSGLVFPDNGVAEINDDKIMQPYSPVALISQNYSASVFHWLTVKENLALGFYKPSLNGNNPHFTLHDAAEFLQIEELLDSYPKQLSGGEKQRVQIGRYLLSSVSFLVFDEPASSLDIEFRQTLQECIIHLAHDHNVGVLLITHDIEEAIYIADRVYILNKDADTNKTVMTEREGFSRNWESYQNRHSSKEFLDTYSRITKQLFNNGQE